MRKTFAGLCLLLCCASASIAEDIPYAISVPDNYAVTQLFGAGRNYVALLWGKDGCMVTGSTVGRQGPYTDIADPVLSSDGTKAGFVYHIGTPSTVQKYYVSTPEKTYGPFQWAKSMCCTPSGDRFGFLYSESDKVYLRVGASRYGPVEEATDLRYVPGAGFSCRYRMPNGWFEFLEGRSWGPYYSLDDIAATADGKTVYRVETRDPYAAELEEGNQGVSYVVADHRMYGPYMRLSPVRMTKDGTGYAYAYRDGQGWHVRSHSRTLGPFPDGAWTNTFTVSSSGSIAYALKESNGGKTLYIDGKRRDVTGDLSLIMLSPDGTTCAVKVRNGDGESFVVLDSAGMRTHGPFERIKDAFLSAGSSELVFVGQSEKGDGIYVNDEVWMKPVGPLDDSGKLPTVEGIYGSPDGTRLAYILKDPSDKTSFLFDGVKAVGWFHGIDKVRFAPDSSCVSYLLEVSWLTPWVVGLRYTDDPQMNSYLGDFFPGGSVYLKDKRTVVVKTAR